MSEPTTEQLAEWRRLANAATAGPWARTETIHAESSVVVEAFPLTRPIARFVTDHTEYGRANAEFVAAARQAVPALVAALVESRQRAEIAEQRLDCLATLFKHAPLRQPVPGGPMSVTFSTAAFQMAYDGGAGQTQWRETESSTDA